ncbi:hypothetical protein H5410_064683 [Solanum commersonii]|uniref:Uncharacterized protein n=1 Tax=Solanum commersonii TaxID=4109 RepID=A0A9J5VZD2_SOLCO|nr:hypothetical protein H5410_064683 [Solanum commersonii]
MSSSGLLQHEQFIGSTPKFLIFSFVGSFALNALHMRNDTLKGIENKAEKIGTLANVKVESYSPSLFEKKNMELIMNVASTSSVAAAAPATGEDAATAPTEECDDEPMFSLFD